MQPNVAVQADGRVAVAWKSADSVCWRIVAAEGSALGDTTCMNVQRSFEPVSVAALGSGYVLAWEEADSDAYNTTYTLKTMTLSATGMSGPIRSTPAPNVIFGLASTTLKSGEAAFLLYDGSHHRVLRVDGAGNVTVPSGLQVETPTADLTIPAAGRITALADGGFLVTWDELDSSRGRAIHMRLFDGAFQPKSGDMVKPGTGQETDALPSALPGGGFAMQWRLANTVVVQRFTAGGAPMGSPSPLDPAWLNSATDTCYNPQPFTCGPRQETAALMATPDGGWIAFWHNLGPHGEWTATSARRFAADGTAVSGPTTTTAPITASRSHPLTSVVPASDGGFFVAWESLDANYAAGTYYRTAWVQRFGGDAVR